MKFLSKSDIYEVGISLMEFLGEHMHSTSSPIYIYRAINCCVMIFVLIFTTANFLHVKGEMYIDTLESWISLNHIFLKYILFIYYKSDMANILNIRLKKYWDYKRFDKRLVDSVEETYNVVKSTETFLLVLTVFLMYMIFLQPVLYKNIVFLVKTWIFIDTIVLDTIVLTCQHYIYIIVIPIVVGYDILYMTLCIDLIIQLRLMKSNLQHISDKSTEDGVRQVSATVQHQLVLLSVFKNLKHIYSSTMLFHYFVTLITACSDMYQLLIGDTSFVNCLLKIPTLLFIFGEFAYYAVLAEQVSFEFSDLSNAIYMSRWYEQDVKVQKLLLFIMVKSQRLEYFTGAGLMDINIDAFGSLVRKTFSFYAIIKNLLNK